MMLAQIKYVHYHSRGIQFHRQRINQLKSGGRTEYRQTWLIHISLHCVPILCMRGPIFNHAKNVLRYAKSAAPLVISVAWFISIDICGGETRGGEKKRNFYAKKNDGVVELFLSSLISPPLHTRLELLEDGACCNVLFKVTLPLAVYRSWFSLTRSRNR